MKSKIKIIIFVFILLLVGIALTIPKTTYQKWFSPNNNNVGEEQLSKVTKQIYVMNSDGYLVGKDILVEKEEPDEIIQKWNLLTINSDMIPSGFTSVVNKNTKLESYDIKDAVLNLNVSEEITDSNGRATAEALAWTFINDEISEVKLFVVGEEVKKINDYQINKITKKMGINLEYETSYLLESNATTVVFCENDYLLPVTYFHLEDDICTYIVSKMAKMADNAEVWDYQYELKEDALVINFQNDLVLSAQVLESLTYSFDANFDLTKLTINNVEKNLYEAVFGEIVEE